MMVIMTDILNVTDKMLFLKTNEMMFKVLMSLGRSWVSVKNCPDSHLELPTVTLAHMRQ